MMDAPINIEYSSIGRLSLKVPWKSLGSSPVEVELENVFLLLSPSKEQDW